MSFTAWQKSVRTKIGYRVFGNCYFPWIHGQYLRFLKRNAPEEFLDREIDDLGCGDGSFTLRITKILEPTRIKGYEVNESLITKARRRDLNVIKVDLETKVPKGEMALIWGVAHHLRDPEKFIRKVCNNYKYAIFREPVKNFWSFLDTGDPLPEKEWRKIFDSVSGNYQFLRDKDSIFVFWKK